MEAKAGVLFLHLNQFDQLILQYQKISVLAVKTPLTALINACHKGQDLDQTNASRTKHPDFARLA